MAAPLGSARVRPQADLSRIRICGTGAAPVPPSLVREMQERMGCPVVIGYTSTEAALTTGSLPGDSAEVIARTVGRARENVELRVVDDDGAEVPAGQVGNVECRSAAAMRGYWRDPDRTHEVLRPDGWLRTGDGGWLDEDGYLTLVGRRTEMYMRGAYNIYPVEVERVISEHPAVAQVAIVAKPDPVLGEIGVAFVVPAAAAEAPTLDELRAWTRQAIADYKAPDVMELVPELPLTPMGKVDKRAPGRACARPRAGALGARSPGRLSLAASAEHAGGPHFRNPLVVVAGHVAQDLFGVLARRRRRARGRQVPSLELHRVAQHVGVDILLGDPGEPMFELRVLQNGLGRVDRSDGGVVLVTEGDPLRAGAGGENLRQLLLQLEVAPGVAAVGRAGPLLEEIQSTDALAGSSSRRTAHWP